MSPVTVAIDSVTPGAGPGAGAGVRAHDAESLSRALEFALQRLIDTRGLPTGLRRPTAEDEVVVVDALAAEVAAGEDALAAAVAAALYEVLAGRGG